MEALKKFIEGYEKIPEKDWELVAPCFRKRVVPKGGHLLQVGQVCNHLSFLESGLLRFYVDRDGVEVTKFFTIAPYFFTSQNSFNLRKPATESIQAIETSVIWETTYQENKTLLELSSWSRFGRKITQEVQFFTEEILEELQSETAENRYRKLLKNDAQLLQRIPLKYLASFLGVAPQSLSRIRKKLVIEERKLT